MLKVTLLDGADELRFRLEGRLSGPYVGELRQCWVTAQSTLHGRRAAIDLREVDYVDSDGRELLKHMREQGVELTAVTPLICEMVQEIEGDCRCATVEEAPRSTNAIPTQPAARSRRAL